MWMSWRNMPTSCRSAHAAWKISPDRKSTRLNSSHADIYTLSLHDALPISGLAIVTEVMSETDVDVVAEYADIMQVGARSMENFSRSEEHTSELQSRRYLHSFPTRRSSDLRARDRHGSNVRDRCGCRGGICRHHAGRRTQHGKFL